MATKGTGVDSWGSEAIVCRGRRKGVTFQITGFERLLAEAGRLRGAAEPIGPAVVGLSGRDLILKYTRVPQVPDWQLAKLMDFEVQEIASQAGGGLSSDYNLLPVANEMTGEDTVLLALAKNSALDEATADLEPLRGRVDAFTPSAIALYNAFLMVGPVSDDDIILLAWVGEESIDLALVRGPSLLFARNVSGGLQILDGAIGQAFNVREERARKIRRDLLNLDPRARGSYASSQEERVAHSVQAVAGQLQAALRSTIAFCQSQTNIQDLSLKRAFVCGPGAKIAGLDRFLAEGLGCTVEVWNPVPDLDLSACPPDQQQAALASGPEGVLALGLAMSPCFDDLYSIEILPEAVKRKRRFATRTVFNIAAAALAIAFLGWRAVDAKAEYGRLEQLAAQASGKLKRAKRLDTSTRAIVDRTLAKGAKLAALEQLAVPLHATLRVLRELRAALPGDLWLTKMSSDEGPATWVKLVAAEGGSRKAKAPRRTYLVVRGSGVSISGADLTQTFAKFKQALEARHVPIRDPSTSTIGDSFTFQFKIDYLDLAGGGKTD